MSIVGLTLGPLSVALLTDYVFEDPTRVGDSLAIVCAVVSPRSAVLMWSALRPFRKWV